MSTTTQSIPELGSDDQLRTVTDETFAKAMWSKLPRIRNEFQTYGRFWGYCRALQNGTRRLTGVVVRDEGRLMAELTGITRGPDRQLQRPRL